MSTDVSFYTVTEYNSGSEIVDTRDLDYNDFWLPDNSDVPQWVRDNFNTVTINNHTIDLFDVGEKMFGKKPISISTHSYNLDIVRFNFENNLYEEVDRNELQPYYFDEIFDGFVCNRKSIGYFNHSFIDFCKQYDDCIINFQIAESLLEEYINQYEQEIENCYSNTDYYYKPLFVLTKVMLTAKDENNIIICHID